MKISPVRAGIVFGLFLAFFHAAWAGLVAAGQAQRLIDFIFWAHFIAPPYQIQPFEFARAAILVGVTFLAGLTFGVVGGAWPGSTAGGVPAAVGTVGGATCRAGGAVSSRAAVT